MMREKIKELNIKLYVTLYLISYCYSPNGTYLNRNSCGGLVVSVIDSGSRGLGFKSHYHLITFFEPGTFT